LIGIDCPFGSEAPPVITDGASRDWIKVKNLDNPAMRWATAGVW
jgi:hypothetical protein